MSEHKPRKTDSNGALSLVAMGFIFFSLALSAYFGWQKYSLNLQKTGLSQAIENQKQTLVKLKEKGQIGERMKAAEILSKANSYRTNWSKVVADLDQTFNSKNLFVFEQVQITEAGQVTVSASTKDLMSTASFLVLINRSEKFENGFISQVSPQGAEADGRYSFSASFDYLANDPS